MPKIYALFFALYGLLWKIALPFLRRNKRIKDGFTQRQIPDDWLMQDIVLDHQLAYEKNPDKPFLGDQKDLSLHPVDIWIQAASGGEAYLACELIKALPKKGRAYRILLTTWTRQGMQILHQECEKILPLFPIESAPFIQIRFAPLDTKEAVNKAINLAKPRACIMLETELWPFFMLLCKQKNIPLYVVNGRMSKSTFELYKIISSVLNYMAPKQILAITKDDMKRFFHIFPNSLVSFMPNIKFDIAYKLVHTHYEKLLKALSSDIEEEARLLSHEISHEEDFLFEKEKFEKEKFEGGNIEKHNVEAESQDIQKKNTQDIDVHKKQNIEQTQDTIKSNIHDNQKDDKNNQREEEIHCFEEINQASFLDQKTYIPALTMLFSKAQKTFLFASIRQEEENYFASLLWKIYPQRKNDIFIIAPRHMHRVKQWRRRFYDLGMKYVIASDVLKNIDFTKEREYSFEPASCVIWDIFGDLHHLYAQTDMAIVGGSYKNLGGQNFLEAIACGTKAHIGSHIDNFLWALGEEDVSHMFDLTLENAKANAKANSLENSKSNATENAKTSSYILKTENKENPSVSQSLSYIGLLKMHKKKKSLEQAILTENRCKKTPYDRLEIQKQFQIWLENRCGGTALALERVLQIEEIE